MIWLWPLSPNGEPVHSQGKIELSSQNAVGASKWADVLGRVALTNGSWKMQDRLIISIFPDSVIYIYIYIYIFTCVRKNNIYTNKNNT